MRINQRESKVRAAILKVAKRYRKRSNYKRGRGGEGRKEERADNDGDDERKLSLKEVVVVVVVLMEEDGERALNLRHCHCCVGASKREREVAFRVI